MAAGLLTTWRFSIQANSSETVTLKSRLLDRHHWYRHNTGRIKRKSGDGKLFSRANTDCTREVRSLQLREQLVNESRYLLARRKCPLELQRFFSSARVQPQCDAGRLARNVDDCDAGADA